MTEDAGKPIPMTDFERVRQLADQRQLRIIQLEERELELLRQIEALVVERHELRQRLEREGKPE